MRAAARPARFQSSVTAVHPGREVKFVFTASNTSITGYGDVVLTIALPPGMRLLGPPAYERGSGCAGTTTITCDLVDLSPMMGTQVSAAIQVTKPARRHSRPGSRRPAPPASRTHRSPVQGSEPRRLRVAAEVRGSPRGCTRGLLVGARAGEWCGA
jgi:uncharacterized repeat protein (TIGR01451 family)